MTDIVLVRHGETTWHADNRYAGGSEVPLTARGRAQAQQLAAWAAAAGLAGVWASDLSRTELTARPCATAAGLPLTVDPRLREVDFGLAEGFTAAELAREIPHELAAFRRDPVANHFPGGEDPRQAASRGLACLREIAVAQPDQRVLVVCHGTLIRVMLCSLLDLPLSDYRRLLPLVRNGHLNEIRVAVSEADQPPGLTAALLSWNAPPVPDEEAHP